MKRIAALCLLLAMVLFCAGCSDAPEREPGTIRLYGETHAVKAMTEKELALWQEFYAQGDRHLFIEMSYYHAQFLNLWMQSDGDDILDQLFQDLAGTYAASDESVKAFYQQIKSNCPETVFHGTDIGHNYDTTGVRYLTYLAEHGQEDSERYSLAAEAMEQGRYYYENGKDNIYRENTMTQNFLREYETIRGSNVMGIYGAAHTDPDGMTHGTQDTPCMAKQLAQVYGTAVVCQDIQELLPESAGTAEPERVDVLEVNGKEYEASYFGKVDLSEKFPDYLYREFWRLENAYEDLQAWPVISDPYYNYLPYSNYPMDVQIGQVFLVRYVLADGTSYQTVYRADGAMYDGELSTWAIRVG